MLGQIAPRGARRPLRRAWSISRAAALTLGLLGAGCDLSGIVGVGDSLLDPDKALLDRPGRLIVAGSYSGLKIAGSAENGGYVLARRDDADDDRVAVVPFLEGEPCEYAPAFSYDRFSSRINLDFPGTLSVQVDQDDAGSALGTVRFIDYECNEVIGEIESTVLPGPLFPGIDPIGMLARRSDGTLMMIDAEERTLSEVAPNVDYGVVAGSFLYTLEAGEVVIRDETLEEVERIGSGAFSLVATGGVGMPLVYEDETGVHAWSEDDGATSLAESGCYLWYIGPNAIAYLDPCDERRLAVRLSTDMAFPEGDEKTFVTLRGPRDTNIDSLTVPPDLAANRSLPLETMIVTQPSAGVPAGTLHVLRLPEDAESDADEVELADTELADEVTYVPSHGLYYRNYGSGRGTLLDFERDDAEQVTGVLEIAENVAWVPFGNPYSYRGILADYDGKEGRLMRVGRSDNTLSRSVIGEGVPLQTFAADADSQLVAYISDLNADDTGVLTIVDEFGSFEAAERALINEIRVLDDPEGVVFLVPGASEGIFELHTWLIKAEFDLLVHNQVSEYIAIPWPSPGLLYSVPGGKDPGLWFAKAR